jgi:hypothetical protein
MNPLGPVDLAIDSDEWWAWFGEELRVSNRRRRVAIRRSARARKNRRGWR